MSIKKVDGPQDHHRFIDEAGDMTFHSGKRGRKTSSIGMDGVSRCFMIGLVHVKSPLDDARATIDGFCEEINSSKFFQSFPSVQKRIKEGWHGFYPHASKDPAELRYEFLKLMAQEIDFSARVVVGRKIPAIYQQRHNEQPREFYADLMSHLLKYSGKIDPLILDVAERGSSTSNLNLQDAVDIAPCAALAVGEICRAVFGAQHRHGFPRRAAASSAGSTTRPPCGSATWGLRRARGCGKRPVRLRCRRSRNR